MLLKKSLLSLCALCCCFFPFPSWFAGAEEEEEAGMFSKFFFFAHGEAPHTDAEVEKGAKRNRAKVLFSFLMWCTNSITVSLLFPVLR